MALIDKALDSIREVKAAGTYSGSGIDYSCPDIVERLPRPKHAAFVRSHEHLEVGAPTCSHCGSPHVAVWAKELWCRSCERSTFLTSDRMRFKEAHTQEPIMKNMWW